MNQADPFSCVSEWGFEGIQCRAYFLLFREKTGAILGMLIVFHNINYHTIGKIVSFVR